MSRKDRDFFRHAGVRAPDDDATPVDPGDDAVVPAGLSGRSGAGLDDGEDEDADAGNVQSGSQALLSAALARAGYAIDLADEPDDDAEGSFDEAIDTAAGLAWDRANEADSDLHASSDAWELVAVQGIADDPYEGRPAERRAALAQIAVPRQTAFGLSRLTSDYVRLSGADKLDVLLGLADPRAALQALSGEEFVFLIKDIGMNDAADLMALASPRQLQACVDLDAWVGDVLDLEAFASWVGVCSEAGIDTVDRFIRAQEDGVLCHYLMPQLRIIEDLEEAEFELPEDWDFFRTPDLTMLVAVPPGHPEMLVLREVIDSLFRHSSVRARGILRATRFELPESLGEDVFAERNRRIHAWGFLPRHEARAMYTFREPYAWRDEVRAIYTGQQPRAPGALGQYLPDDEPDRLGLVLRGEETGGFLGAALQRCPADHQQRLQLAFVRLAYQALAAREERPTEIDALANWSRHALRTCEMGLTHLCAGDLGLAAILLQQMRTVELFRAGHSLVLLLHHAARDLRRRLGGHERLALVDSPDRALLEGLLRPLPMLAVGSLGIATSGESEPGGAEPADVQLWRPFESLVEIEAARVRLHGMRACVLLLDRLAEGDLPAAVARIEAAIPAGVVDDLRLSTLLGTAIAWQVLDGSPLLEALPIDRLRRFLRLAFEGFVGQRQVRGTLRERLAQVPASVPGLSDHEVAGLQRLIEHVLARLADELGGVDPDGPIELQWAGTALAVSARSQVPLVEA